MATARKASSISRARLGLESTGVALPIAKAAKTITAPDSEPILVLIGSSHPDRRQLIKNKKWERPSLQPGEGLIQIVKKAFGEKSALIVTGGDAAGVDRAVHQLAEKFPAHLGARQGPHDARRCRRRREEVRRRPVAGRAGGDEPVQAREAREAARRTRILSSARVNVFVEKAADGSPDDRQQEAAAKIKAARSLTVDVQNLDVQKGRSLVTDEFEIASEVDEFWTKFRTRVIPAVRKQQPVVRRGAAQRAAGAAPADRAAGAGRADQGRRRREGDRRSPSSPPTSRVTAGCTTSSGRR